MRQTRSIYRQKVLAFLASFIIIFGIAGHVYSDVTINILAVNGTEETKEKNIRFVLPPDLSAEDIIDPAGLKTDYDIAEGAYFVHGEVILEPKETKTYKVIVKDIWKIEEKIVADIEEQIEINYDRLKDTEYYDAGLRKKESLHKRLNSILAQQERYANDVKKRIDSYKVYEGELNGIRKEAISVAYWRSDLADENTDTVRFIVEAQNKSDTEVTKQEHEHFLPASVKPEHVVEAEGFEVHYDAVKAQTYIVKEDEFQPSEKKRFNIEIIDVWNIKQIEIENLRERTRKTYKLLEKSKYLDSAEYLVRAIKYNLGAIEVSQSKDKEINEHISDFKENARLYDLAKSDVDSLESLLTAVLEDLERSKLKNVLMHLKSLADIANLAKNLFKKPTYDTFWQIITGVILFVAILTIYHFSVWAKRSKDKRMEEEEDEEGSED